MTLSPASSYPGSSYVIPCPAVHRHRGVPCAPSVCRAALLALASDRRAVETRERMVIPANSAELVVSPDQWRARAGAVVA